MKKKKILLLSDDLRMSSGVGTVSKEFVIGTMNHYDWAQIGGAIKHPDAGKVVDMKDALKEDFGIDDGYLRIYPSNGYGNPEMLRSVLRLEKPDAIMIYTDPRFWMWLYQMEREVRSEIPIFYYNIWDDLPYPMWNQPFYESCDLLMNISKQTVNIVKNVRQNKPVEDWQCTYVPHGINSDDFKPIDETDAKFVQFRDELSQGHEYSFIVYFNNRNIRRKNPGDVLLSFKTFTDKLPEEEREKCALVMHTHPVDDNGTDLPAVAEALMPDLNVIFSGAKLETDQMNYLYNIADITINIASNEGFGLGTAESLMAGTPIILNVTGGMQDQCGFRYKGKLLTAKDYEWVHSLHNRKEWKDNDDLTWGEWVKPVWPSNRCLQGSPPTPYIFDDRCRWDDVGERILEWYDMSEDKRRECGEKGVEFVNDSEIMMSGKMMSQNFIDQMDTGFEKWTPRKRYSIFKA